MTSSSRASGAINILGNTGTITLGNTGVPVAGPGASPQADPQPQQIPIGAIVAVASNPQVQSVLLASARRIGGGISYALTGRCPGSAPAMAPAPAAYAMVPQQTYQAVPVQMVQAAPQYLIQAPAAVQASPQMMMATPTAPKKCRLFGK